MQDSVPLRPNRMLVDSAIAALVLSLTLQPLMLEPLAYQSQADVHWWDYLLVVVECIPLAWRRAAPFTTFQVVGAATSIHVVLQVPEPFLPFAAIVSIYTVVAYGRRPFAWAALAITAVAVLVLQLTDGGPDDFQSFTVNYVVFGTAWLLGDVTRQRRESSALVEQRAAAEERSEMAREMHDVVAHHVSLMVVQAEAGPALLDTSPERAVRAFDTISATGREALTELRRVLSVLRTAEPAERDPTPGLDSLPRLLDGVRATGLAVHETVTGSPAALPAAVDRAAYRVVQESLTNAVRHARTVSVSVEYDSHELRLSILDGGDGRRRVVPGSGAGLAGMRERVTSLGGRFAAGPDPAGSGWLVTVTLPTSEAVR